MDHRVAAPPSGVGDHRAEEAEHVLVVIMAYPAVKEKGS